MTDNPERQGDVTKLWLTTPTYNVYRGHDGWAYDVVIVTREGMPGNGWVGDDTSSSLYKFVHDMLTPFINGERFISGVIEFDTGDQIRFDVPVMYQVDEKGRGYHDRAPFCDWKIRGSTYGGRWEDAADVDDATLCHRAIVAYQTYRGERGDE